MCLISPTNEDAAEFKRRTATFQPRRVALFKILTFTHAVSHNESTSNTRSAPLRASSHGSLFYTTVAAERCASHVNIMRHGRMFTIVCFMVWILAWTRYDALVRGYGKIGRLRPQACTCVLFQNGEILRHFIVEVMQSAVWYCTRMTKVLFFEILENGLLSSPRTGSTIHRSPRGLHAIGLLTQT